MRDEDATIPKRTMTIPPHFIIFFPISKRRNRPATNMTNSASNVNF